MTSVPHRRTFPQLRADNISFTPGAGKGGAMALAVAGAVCVALVALAGATGLQGVYARHALASFHVGALAALTICLGATFFVMLFYLTNAGWVGTIRRQFENVMSFLPAAFVLAIATPVVDYLIGGGKLFTWMNHANYGDYLLQKKFAYFFAVPYSYEKHGELASNIFPVLFFARLALYGVVWTLLTRRLLSLSLTQDQTGDVALSAKARFTSAWGILVMALTTAFAGFDLLMSLDYRFFSTMWGVYIFAGSAFSSIAMLALILARLRAKGKLEGAVTSEHFHDIGKFMFSFTVFWAYIGFSQYFLIWYSNIPEETAFYIWREQRGWQYVGALLILGHFVAPFLILLFRGVKRSPALLSVMALWALFIHIVDLTWIVRPMAYVGADVIKDPGLAAAWVDIAGALGPILLLGAYLVYRIGRTSLVAVNDPYMHEALEHKNYV